jgi:hypothetical protein
LAHANPQVLPLGYTHPPKPSQSEAPQAPTCWHVTAQQCVPVPEVPHAPPVHWSFAEHVAPAPTFAMQDPPAQYVLDDWQSLSVLQDGRHEFAFAHFTPPGQALGVPPTQFPDPSQESCVS